MWRCRAACGLVTLSAFGFMVTRLDAKRIESTGWVPDASRAVIPSHPARGTLYGRPFTVNTATLAPYKEWSGDAGKAPSDHVDGGVLTLQQGTEEVPTRYFTLFLAVRPGSSVDGRTFAVPAGGLFKQTEKIMDRDGKGWFYPVAGVQAYSKNGETEESDVMPLCSMKLVFGRRHGNVMPGKIYLCLGGKKRSYVAGAFEAEIEKE